MNSNMVKPEKFGHLQLVYHFIVPIIFFKKTLDKKNDQVSLEFKIKVNNGRFLQQVCSPSIVCYIIRKVILLCFYNMLYDMLNEF